MTYEAILAEEDARGIVRLRLNRPEKRNALSARMITEMADFAAAATPRRDWRAIILSGLGDMFCAGGDLAWMRAQMAADRNTRMAEARKLALLLKVLNELPQPLIGAIHGGAFGGGVGMASVCDVAIAADGTRFGLTETRLGLIPATIGPYVLARLGEGRARRVFMSARLFGADEEREFGLISRIVAPDDLGAAAEAEAALYLACAPGAVAAAKVLARRLAGLADDRELRCQHRSSRRHLGNRRGPRRHCSLLRQTSAALADGWMRLDETGCAAGFRTHAALAAHATPVVLAGVVKKSVIGPAAACEREALQDFMGEQDESSIREYLPVRLCRSRHRQPHEVPFGKSRDRSLVRRP